ncbi:PKD-like domain-containing protein [Bacteroides pyogenes]|uniref:PKD-like domain-containing protein n=1 Tax=Bacteroides pyogenes TaxID=310300 RepID=UPI002A7EE276|nr:PKD-like domain-containing protein [Bacteroides pyogenes]MDY4250411.1 PKD-like domain-containing protein [Bacteroides pyogenes]
MKKRSSIATLLAATFLFIACKEEVLAPEITGMDTGTAEYALYIGEKVTLAPNITNLHGSNHYLWLIDNKEVATGNLDYTFTATKPGTFIITFRAENKGGMNEKHFKVFVDEPIRIAFAQKKVEVPRCEVIEISPVITGPQRDDYQYEWAIGDSILGNKPTLEFISAKPGTYTLTLKAKADRQTETSSCAVEVKEADYKVFPNKVFDYRPTAWGSGSFWYYPFGSGEAFIYSENEMVSKISEHLSEQATFPASRIGAWGGYWIWKFDHTVLNIKNKYDLQLTIDVAPGSVLDFFVAYDKNKNGIPDEDEWYEIKTTDIDLPHIKNYELTLTYKGYDKRILTFAWEDNQGNGGTETKRDGVFPGYRVVNKVGTKVAEWAETFTLKGRMFKVIPFGITSTKQYTLNINDAITAEGEPISLPGIDFLKVQNISMTYNKETLKPTGGSKQEVKSIVDLHLLN